MRVERFLEADEIEKNNDNDRAKTREQQAKNARDTLKATDLTALKSVFDSSKNSKDAINVLTNYFNSKGMGNVSKSLEKYSNNNIKTIKDWLNAMGWEQLGNKKHPFIKILNHPSTSTLLNGDDKKFRILYNISVEKPADVNDWDKYLKGKNLVIFNNNLYKQSYDNIEKLIRVDSELKDNTRIPINRAIDKGNFTDFIAGDNSVSAKKDIKNFVDNRGVGGIADAISYMMKQRNLSKEDALKEVTKNINGN